VSTGEPAAIEAPAEPDRPAELAARQVETELAQAAPVAPSTSDDEIPF
jgi:hypothetical protein